MGYSSQNLSAAIGEVYSQKTEKIYRTTTVMLPIVSQQYQSDLRFGDTVHVQRPGQLVTMDYTRNQPMTLQASSMTDDTLVIDQQKYIYHGVDDFDQAQSHHKDLLNMYAYEAADAMRITVDTHLLGHYTDALAANVQGSTGSPISLTADNLYDYFMEVHEDLDNQNVEGERHAVLPPKFTNLIARSPELRERGTSLVDDVVRNGYVGNFAGFKIHKTTNMSQVSGTYPLMFFVKDFIQFVEQKSIVKAETPDGYLNKAMAIAKLYGSKVFNPEAGAVIYASAA